MWGTSKWQPCYLGEREYGRWEKLRKRGRGMKRCLGNSILLALLIDDGY